MGAIDGRRLTKAMNGAGVSKQRLASETGLSLQYVCDITAGRRTLKRNPALRKQIARVLDVPTDWIEHHETGSDTESVGVA